MLSPKLHTKPEQTTSLVHVNLSRDQVEALSLHHPFDIVPCSSCKYCNNCSYIIALNSLNCSSNCQGFVSVGHYCMLYSLCICLFSCLIQCIVSAILVQVHVYTYFSSTSDICVRIEALDHTLNDSNTQILLTLQCRSFTYYIAVAVTVGQAHKHDCNSIKHEELVPYIQSPHAHPTE